MNRDVQADREQLLAIQRHAQGGELARAGELAAAALAEGLEHPLIFNVLALRHELAGELLDAERLLRRALTLAPEDMPARNALGLCLLRLERHEEALEQFDALIATQPSLPFAHASRGTALLELARVSEADSAFRRAIELDAGQAVALAGLARIAWHRGDLRQGRGWAERALERLPGYPDAELTLAAAELGELDPLAAEARLSQLLARQDLSAQQRATASGLLGDVLDAQERVPEAFAAYTHSNDLQREAYAPRFADRSPSALQYANGLADYLRGADPKVWRAPPAAPASVAGHIFVLGFPRSGTSLLDVILSGHPQVASLEENELLIDAIQQFMQRPEDLHAFAQASPAVYERLRAAYWYRVKAAGGDVDGKIFLDKNTLNILKLPLIARLFPQAKILFACRDPRDIVLSCFRHRFRMSAPLYELLTLEGAARYYDALMRVLMECTRLLGLEMCLVRHEDVVSGFAREMRRVCDFLGLAWDPAMGDFALREREEPATNPGPLAKGLDTEGVGHWLRYREQLAPVLNTLAPWVKQFYYDEPGGSGRLNQQLNATVIRSPSPSNGVT